MKRIAIVGPSECGKSSLGMSFVNSFLRARVPVIACDWATKWPAAYQTEDIDAFVAYAQRAWGCCLLLDELGKKARQSDSAEWVFTSSRHREHDVISMLHTGMQLTPLARNQFNTLCIFNSTPEVCDFWRQNFNDAGILAAEKLGLYEFLLKEKNKPIRRMKLTNPPKLPKMSGGCPV